MDRFAPIAAIVILAAGLASCALDDDPAVTAAMREDAHCRTLGAVPQTQLYLDCRRALFIDRDQVFAARVRAEETAKAAKAAKSTQP